MTVRAGAEAVVAVAAATLWAAPERVGTLDSAAVAVPADIRAWVAALSKDNGRPSVEELSERVLTQLLLGERVIVDEVRDEWARVVAIEQPAPEHDKRGYPGWLPLAQLTPVAADPVSGPEYVVSVAATALRDEPDGDVLTAGVALGTKLIAVGKAYHGWLPVTRPGSPDPDDLAEAAWARARDVALAPAVRPSGVGAEALAIAELFLDVPYVWGALSPYGIDCSGLVHLAFRRLGVSLPRDAGEQAAALPEVPLGEERPGDLYVFAYPGKPIHHIGFVDGERHMLHACSINGAVVSEPLAGERAETLTGARRVN